MGADSRKLGLVAGGGALPIAIAHDCRAQGRPLFVVRLDGFAEPELEAFEGATVGLGRFGDAVARMREAGCEAVCFAGNVARPDLSKLSFDELGMRSAPALMAAAAQGDDALLRAVAQVFEGAGFDVEGAQAASASLLLPAGPLGAISPSPEHQADIERALQVARAVGALDVGQGAVVALGLVLAVEAQEGTDAMLERVAGLPQALRGSRETPLGVLAKTPKPIQDRRIDLPVIGAKTIQGAADAGLAGVVGEAGGVLLLDRERLIALADELGLFVVGVEPAA